MIARAWIIARKEFRHFAHDPLTLALTLVLPLFQLIFYGYALDTQVRHVAAAVLNHDEHSGGRVLAQRLSRSALFAVEPGYGTQAQAQAGLRSGAIRVAIEIPADYTANLTYARQASIRVWVDGSDAAIANYVLSALYALGFEGAAGTAAAMAPVRLFTPVDVRPQVLFNPEGSTAVFVIPGLIAVLAQTITMLLLAISITGERERGTLEQMLITPLGANAILFGKAMAVACVGFGEACVLVLTMRYLFGIAIQGSVFLLAAVLPLLVLAPLGLGLLIAGLARNVWQALQLAFLVTLLSEMLSGFVFAREQLAPPMRWVSQLLPATYAIGMTRNVILRGTSVSETGPLIATAALYGMVVAGVGWWVARRRIRSAARSL